MQFISWLSIYLMALSAHAGPVVQAMKSNIGDNTRIEEVIRNLPDDLRNHFTLVHSGNALIQTSLAYPGVILFGRDARTLIAFGGDPKLTGYNVIDVLEYNDRLARYEPYRFFYSPSAKDVREAQPLERIGRSQIYFESKPQACVRCHGQSSHPIFESGYPDWKGFYGSNRDHLYGSQNKSEAESYRKFLKGGRQTSRYQTLLFPPETHSEFSPFLDEYTEKKLGYPDAYVYRPNLMFGAQVARVYSNSVYQSMKQSPHFSRYSTWLAFALQKCDFQTVDGQRLKTLEAEIDRIGATRDRSFLSLKLKSSSFLANELSKNRSLSAKILSVMGVSSARWNLSSSETQTTDYGYWSGFGDMYEFIHAKLVADIYGEDVKHGYRDEQFPVQYLSTSAHVLTPIDQIASCKDLVTRLQ